MMKKRILIPALLLALLTALSACTGDSQPEETVGETVAGTQPGTVDASTEPEETEAPESETKAPETTPPETNPPDTMPPETNPPETNPPETNPPETNPPETNPPETNPPETKPADDPDVPADADTHNFKSDIAADAELGFAYSDVAYAFNYMDAAANGNSRIENGLYKLEGFTQMFMVPDGKYAFTAEKLNSTNKFGAAMFVRGVQGFNFGDGGYFGTDQNSFSCGCGGIYITAEAYKDASYKLNIVFRSYNGTENRAILSDYSVIVPSADITVADDGSKLSILSGNELAATIEISGTRDFAYEGVAADACAETVTLTLAGSEPVVIENAVVAAGLTGDAGFCTRSTCGVVSFSGVSFGSYYDVTIPDTFLEVEDKETDPNKVIHVIEGEALVAPAGANGVGSSTLEDGYVKVVPNSKDPYYLLPAGFYGGRYVAVKYRTSTAGGCNTQIYVGSSGSGPTNDNTMLEQVLIGDGEWHLAIFDLDNLTEKLNDEYYVSYFRFDALQAGYIRDENGNIIYGGTNGQVAEKLELPEGADIDVAYIAFFHSEEAALIYEYYTFNSPSDIGHKNSSFDTFFVNGNMYFPVDGGAGQKLNEIGNTITFAAGEEHSAMSLRGWIGFDQTIAQFGYYIDSPANVVWGDFAQNTEQGVLDAGGQYASRFQINADLSALEAGTHTVGYVVKLADGKQAILHQEITVVIEGAASELVLVENWDSVSAEPFYGWGSCASDGNGNLKLNCDGTNIVCVYGINGAMMNSTSAPLTGFKTIRFTIDTTTSASDILFIFQPENGAGNNLTTGNVGKATLIKEDGSTVEIEATTTADPRTGYIIPQGTKGTLILPYTTISTYDDLNTSAFASAEAVTLTRLGFMILPAPGHAGGEAIVGDVYIEKADDAPADPLAKADSVILPDGMLAQPADYAPSQTNKNLFGNDAMGDAVSKQSENDVDYTHYAIAAGSQEARILFKRKYSGFAGAQYMLIKYRTDITESGVSMIGYNSSDAESGDGVASFTASWVADGQWQYLAVDVSALSGITFDENGKVSVLNLTLFNGAAAANRYIDIQYIAFFNSAEDMAAAQQ